MLASVPATVVNAAHQAYIATQGKTQGKFVGSSTPKRTLPNNGAKQIRHWGLGGKAPVACGLRIQVVYQHRRFGKLRTEHFWPVLPCCDLPGQDLEGRQARWSSRRAARFALKPLRCSGLSSLARNIPWTFSAGALCRSDRCRAAVNPIEPSFELYTRSVRSGAREVGTDRRGAGSNGTCACTSAQFDHRRHVRCVRDSPIPCNAIVRSSAYSRATTISWTELPARQERRVRASSVPNRAKCRLLTLWKRTWPACDESTP